MPKFKKGDRVKVRFDTTSPYRGRIGVVDREPFKDFHGFGYMVRFGLEGSTTVCRFIEQDLEPMSK